MLHLPGWIALAMDIAYLLELESPLQGDRILDASAQIEEIGNFEESVSKLLIVLVGFQQVANEVRQPSQLFGKGFHTLLAQHSPYLTKIGCQQEQGSHGRGKGFGSADTYLQPGPDVYHPVGEAGGLAAHDVADSYLLTPFSFGLVHSGQG